MRSSPLRWLPVTLVALLLLAWITLDLLPRFVGGLLGEGQSELGIWDGDGADLPEISWDTTDPRAAAPGEASETPDSDEEWGEIAEETAEAETEPLEEIAPPGSDETGAGGEIGEGTGAEPAGAAEGSGPGAGQRRAATLLFQEWPSQELLSRLEAEGRFRFMVDVKADGKVSGWELLEGFDCEECRREAERIVAGLRFRPAKEDGRAAPCRLPFEIRFSAN